MTGSLFVSSPIWAPSFPAQLPNTHTALRHKPSRSRTPHPLLVSSPIMIRAGLASSLRSVGARQLGPLSSSSSLSSPLVLRPFSSSPSSRADGLFPTHPKQDIYDGAGLLKEAGVGSISPPDSREGLEAPPHLALPTSDTLTPSTAADIPPTAETPEDPTSGATSVPPSEQVADLGLGSPDSPSPSSLLKDSFYAPPSSMIPSSSSSDPSSSTDSDAPFDFTPITPPTPPSSATLLARAQAASLLSEARKDLPAAVTEAEWKYLKGPHSEMKVIRYSLHCRKNNTQGTLSWAYRPDNRSTPDYWNAVLLGTSQYSGGRLGFKGAQSGTAEAGHQVVVAMFRKVEEENNREIEKRRKRNEEAGIPRSQGGYLEDRVGVHVRLHINGFGQGREAFFKALKSEEGSLMRQLTIAIADHTPIKSVLNLLSFSPSAVLTSLADHLIHLVARLFPLQARRWTTSSPQTCIRRFFRASGHPTCSRLCVDDDDLVLLRDDTHARELAFNAKVLELEFPGHSVRVGSPSCRPETVAGSLSSVLAQAGGKSRAAHFGWNMKVGEMFARSLPLSICSLREGLPTALC